MDEIITPGQEAPQQTETVAAINPFDEGAWVEQDPSVPQGTNDSPQTEEVKPEVETPEAQKPEAEATKAWYETFGYESEDAAKAEIETLRSLKDKEPTPAETQFANEQSKRLFEAIREGKEDEVFQILDQKRKLSAVDTMPAADALRLHLQMANKHFSPEDVQDVMEERYALPSKPLQELHESDEDFQIRENAYQSVVQKVERKMAREAVEAREALKKINQELVLPEIKGQGSGAEPTTAQSSADIEKARQTYLQTLERDFSQFNGFSATYKDEEVELPVAYTVDEAEKTALKERLKNFDVDGFILSRWFNPKDGSPNAAQIAADVYALENGQKVTQKLVTEAVNQRLAHERKKSANINVTGGQRTLNPQATNDTTEMANHFFSQ
jgi:hypothetical protein